LTLVWYLSLSKIPRLEIIEHDIYIWVNKSKRWAMHVARMGERRGAYRIFVGKLVEGGHLEDSEIDGRIVLK